MATEDLIRNLIDQSQFDNTTDTPEIHETYISWVIVSGEYAYKFKKDVKYPYCDFSTVELRRKYCELEVSLNQRFSEGMYLCVCSVTGTIDNPTLTDNSVDTMIEPCIKMKSFDNQYLASILLQNQKLTSHDFQFLGHQIADFHTHADTAPQNSLFGRYEQIECVVLDNFVTIENVVPALADKLDSIKKWTKEALQNLKHFMIERKENEQIVSGHGDLHLNNIVRIDTHLTPFDCIEFNDDFRLIDKINDIAFLTMDLDIFKCKQFKFSFLNAYLRKTHDYDGFRLLRFYEVYRAMVRAKVEILSSEGKESPSQQHHIQSFLNYITYIHQQTEAQQPILILTHGFSGSGKSYLVEQILDELSLLRLESDYERLQHDSTKEDYSDTSRQRVYNKLRSHAEVLLESHYSVLIDATFLQRQHRHLFYGLALRLGIPVLLLDCQAHIKTLKERVLSRYNKEESSVQEDVLNLQVRTSDQLDEKEREYVITVNTEIAIDIKEIVQRINRYKDNWYAGGEEAI